MSSQPEKGIANDRNIFHTEKQGSIMEGNTEVIFVGQGTHSRSLLFAPKEIDIFGPADDLFRIKDGIGNSTLADAVRHIRGLDDPKSIQNLLEMITPIDPTLLDNAQEAHRVSQEATPTSLWDQMRDLYETNPRNLSPDQLDTAAGVVDTVLHVLESNAYTRMHTRNVQGKHIGLTPVIHEEAQKASQRLATWLEHQQTVANQNQKDAFHRAVQLPAKAAASLVIAQMMISACSPMEAPPAPPPPIVGPEAGAETVEAAGTLGLPIVKETETSGAPTKEPSDVNSKLVGGPSELPKSVTPSEDKPTPTNTAEPEASPTMSKYLRDYLAPIPTGGPEASPTTAPTGTPENTPANEPTATQEATATKEASPTAEPTKESLVEEGPVVLNQDKRTFVFFSDFKKKVEDLVENNNGVIPDLNALWDIDIIPQYIFWDAKTGKVGMVTMPGKFLKQQYGDKRGVSPQDLEKCVRLAFEPFLEGWDNPEDWKYDPDTKRVLNTWYDETAPVKQEQCGWQYTEITSKNRIGFKKDAQQIDFGPVVTK